jgi:hypothetical protein
MLWLTGWLAWDRGWFRSLLRLERPLVWIVRKGGILRDVSLGFLLSWFFIDNRMLL